MILPARESQRYETSLSSTLYVLNNIFDRVTSMKALRVVGSHGPSAKRYLAMYRTANAGQVLVEEEALSQYDALQYYPVHINETFCNRYKVAVKLGFGGSSTVWLCQDAV